MDEMIALNKDKKEIAFVIGDTPTWILSQIQLLSKIGQLTTCPETYAGVYYPHGLSTDLSGNDVVIPSSAIASTYYRIFRSIILVCNPGLTRGVVTNASKVGYVNDESEFTQVRLSNGQRDVLYTKSYESNRRSSNQGLVVYGQKTAQAFASALDPINVARLTNYMRFNLDQLSRGFLFEQNDKITRDNMRDAVERFCGELVTNRGLYDFLVVCDESNNTMLVSIETSYG